MKKFRDLDIEDVYSADFDSIPLAFYETTFPHAKEVKLFLGYFSTNAIREISGAFARLIINEGKLKIITNQYYSKQDADRLMNNQNELDKGRLINIISDYVKLKKALSETDQHFFDCLRFLKQQGRLEIQPVDYVGSGDSHHKQILMSDGEDYIATFGSNNFTLKGLVKNAESFAVLKSWTKPKTKKTINEAIKVFDKVFAKKAEGYKYLDPKTMLQTIDKIGEDKNKNQLIENSYKVLGLNPAVKSKIAQIRKKRLEEEKRFLNHLLKKKKTKLLQKNQEKTKEPSFPDFNNDGIPDEPYFYQKEAQEAWASKKSNKIGLFEMATGTGKTLTAIYCMIKDSVESKKQKNIIVVPGKELVVQWKKEMEDCGFSRIICWHSGNSRLNKQKQDVAILKSSNKPLNIIITYNSFSSKTFAKIFEKNLQDYIVVFDEAHRMGAHGVMKAISKLKFKKRIGLSATPFRDWDEQGSNDFINSFFNSTEPTYSFPMEKAIKGIRLPNGKLKKFLCDYNYFPSFCCLSTDEWEEYKQWTKLIPIKDENKTINEKAALMRQMVIDKADQKIPELIAILEKLVKENNYSNTLVYCPKGKDMDDLEAVEHDEKIINAIEKQVAKKFKTKINGQRFVGETIQREELLKEFEDQSVDLLYAVKCLDEGVNVPSTRNAIFLASGKNKREFIQRRGRILRIHKDKDRANIYDIVVLPTKQQFTLDKSYSEKLIIGEFGRFIEFLEISVSKKQAIKTINKKLEELGLSYKKVIKIIEENRIENEKRRDSKKNS